MNAHQSTPAAGTARPLVTIASATLGALLCTAAATAAPAGHARAAAPAHVTAPAPVSPVANRSAAGDTASSYTMHGGEEGTVFRSLTIEGEDRIHIEVERPALVLGLDPATAPGLDWGSPLDVLERTGPDPLVPLLDATARESSPYVARPWLSHFESGPVARIRPDVKGVEQWKLTVVDERGATAASFAGRGDPPAEIAWNGRLPDGTLVQPGVTYSYVLEAHDRAGNKRNFVGDGFRVTAFRADTPDGPAMVFTGAELRGASDSSAPPIMLEAAGTLNRAPGGPKRVRVNVTARTSEEAAATAQRVTRWLAPNLAGDPSRIETSTAVRPDAPVGGAIRISAAR